MSGNYENSALRNNYDLNTPTHCSLRLVLSSFVLHNGYTPIATMTRHLTDRSILTPQRVQYIVTLADDMSVLLVTHHANMLELGKNVADKKKLNQILSDLFIGLLCDSFCNRRTSGDGRSCWTIDASGGCAIWTRFTPSGFTVRAAFTCSGSSGAHTRHGPYQSC